MSTPLSYVSCDSRAGPFMRPTVCFYHSFPSYSLDYHRQGAPCYVVGVVYAGSEAEEEEVCIQTYSSVYSLFWDLISLPQNPPSTPWHCDCHTFYVLCLTSHWSPILLSHCYGLHWHEAKDPFSDGNESKYKIKNTTDRTFAIIESFTSTEMGNSHNLVKVLPLW